MPAFCGTKKARKNLAIIYPLHSPLSSRAAGHCRKFAAFIRNFAGSGTRWSDTMVIAHNQMRSTVGVVGD